MTKKKQVGSIYMVMFSGILSISLCLLQPLVVVLSYSSCKCAS